MYELKRDASKMETRDDCDGISTIQQQLQTSGNCLSIQYKAIFSGGGYDDPDVFLCLPREISLYLYL